MEVISNFSFEYICILLLDEWIAYTPQGWAFTSRQLALLNSTENSIASTRDRQGRIYLRAQGL